MNLKSTKKAIFSFLVVVASILGVKYWDLDWWVGFLLAIIDGLVVYWAKNGQGTLLHKSDTD